MIRAILGIPAIIIGGYLSAYFWWGVPIYFVGLALCLVFIEEVGMKP